MIINISGEQVAEIKWSNGDCMGDTDLHNAISTLINYKLSYKNATHYSGKLTNLIGTTIDKQIQLEEDMVENYK